eukprot:TRINITY_DN1308_c0_g1_i1.p1 TRINITY_DN1308_c0_g1~~TRINITY_DN1308_c0_g1_i1.p1  ORF type:complete len:302 (+),score=132.54 TRINITY_DN1308_c0_g1_i1:89-907(+)
MVAAVLATAAAFASVPTVQIADGVMMPVMNLGTCCGSQPSVGLGPWLDAGGHGIDTAWDYKDQPDIAKVLAEKKVDRSKLFITSKVPTGGNFTADDAFAKVQEDLKQLAVSQLDLVLLHWPSGNSAADAAQYQGLERALSMNLTRAIGVSNFNQAQIEGLQYKVKPAVNQCEMNVKKHDDATIAYCQKEGIAYEAYHAMSGCDFSSSLLAQIAQAHNKSVSQVCLRYVLDRDCILAVGTGADPTKVGPYAKENMGVFDFKLTADEVAKISNM